MGNIENYKILAKNLVISIVLTLILLFVLSIILSVTSLSESIMGVGIIFISSFSNMWFYRWNLLSFPKVYLK